MRGLKDYSVSQHPILTRDWLADRYVTRGLSLRSIAADAPPALRPAITGPGAWKRLRRLAAASKYSSLSEAGASLGIESTVLVSFPFLMSLSHF